MSCVDPVERLKLEIQALYGQEPEVLLALPARAWADPEGVQLLAREVSAQFSPEAGAAIAREAPRLLEVLRAAAHEGVVALAVARGRVFTLTCLPDAACAAEVRA